MNMITSINIHMYFNLSLDCKLYRLHLYFFIYHKILFPHNFILLLWCRRWEMCVFVIIRKAMINDFFSRELTNFWHFSKWESMTGKLYFTARKGVDGTILFCSWSNHFVDCVSNQITKDFVDRSESIHIRRLWLDQLTWHRTYICWICQMTKYLYCIEEISKGSHSALKVIRYVPRRQPKAHSYNNPTIVHKRKMLLFWINLLLICFY